eukprot:402079-Prorocentrum_lima.AAC.1
MTSSLVGSEMCIRDRIQYAQQQPASRIKNTYIVGESAQRDRVREKGRACLLYTSDAADDM